MFRIIEIHSLRHFSVSPLLLKNHYETLGVNRDASQKEIKKAFYELSKKHHPDMNPGNDKESAEMFSMVSFFILLFTK